MFPLLLLLQQREAEPTTARTLWEREREVAVDLVFPVQTKLLLLIPYVELLVGL